MKNNRTLPILVFALIGVIYWLTQNPFVSFGDSVGVLYYASQGFDLDTNATSHFLYLNVCAFLLLPGWGNPVAVLTGASIVFALLALFRLYQLLQLTGIRSSTAAMIVLMMALSFTWWRQAVTIEVYAMSSWIAMEILLAMGKNYWLGEWKRAWQVAIWMGIALLTHIQFLLLIPAVMLYWWWGKGRSIFQKFGPLLLMLLISSPLILIPLVFDTHPISEVFFDAGYQDQVLGIDVGSLVMGSLRSLGYLLYNFHVFVPLLLVGLWKNWKIHNRWTFLLLLAAAPIWAFAMRYNVTDNYVFFLLPYFILCALSGPGWEWVGEKLKPIWIRLGLAICLSPILYFTAWQIAAQIPRFQQFAEPKAYKGGLQYYFWPGQSQSADPLQLAREIRSGEREPIPDFDRYDLVLRYLGRTEDK